MAELKKLNNLGIAKSKHQLDMEALQRGAAKSGSLVAPAPPPLPAAPMAPKAEDVDAAVMALDPTGGEYGQLDDAVAAQQAANLKNPGIQDKLNMMAKARAKFYGEGK